MQNGDGIPETDTPKAATARRWTSSNTGSLFQIYIRYMRPLNLSYSYGLKDSGCSPSRKPFVLVKGGRAIPNIDAADLSVSLEEFGDVENRVALLLDGWPDNASTWRELASVVAGDVDGVSHKESFTPVPKQFGGPFEMIGLPDFGHFPSREAPKLVADLLVSFFAGERP